MINEYSGNLSVPNNNWHVLDPYYFVRIDSIDNANIIQEYVKSFTPGDFTEILSGDWIGLKRSDASANITFTKSFTLPKTGKYLIEIFGYKRPQVARTAAGDMTVSVAGTTIHTEAMFNSWADYGTWIRCPIVELSSGSNQVILTVPKHAFVAYIRINPITRYEGGRDYVGPSNTKLDLMDIEFSFNGVNEVDTGNIKVAFKEAFYTDDNPYSTLCFDAWDHVTIWIGEDMQNTMPIFGGYVSGWKMNDERTELDITIIDRIFDLSRTYVWKNFSIGYIPKETGTTMPFTQFPNVNEIARYLSTTVYPIDFNAISRDYVLYSNFDTSDKVTGLTVFGYEVEWQPEFGNPAPCMKIRPGKLEESYVTLYSDVLGTWDATIFNYFNFDYYKSGAGTVFPMRFNIEIDMYFADQLPSDALTYTIYFSGNSTGTRVLGTVLPQNNGGWNHFLVDLKALFNHARPSTNYYIKEIRLVGTPNETEVTNARSSSVFIDHVMGYRDFQSSPRYASQDSKTPLHELQDMCEKCNQIAYVRPGNERREDQLIMIPKRFYTIPIEIKEDENLISISSLEYSPINWGLINGAHRSFKYDEKRSGTILKENIDSKIWYNSTMDHEFLSDVKTLNDANTSGQYFVDEHAFHYPAFSVVVKGSTLFEPGQYVSINIPSRRINGVQEVKSLNFTLDCITNKFCTEISFNQPHRKFMQLMRQLLKTRTALQNSDNSASYRSSGNTEAALRASSGAYTNF